MKSTRRKSRRRVKTVDWRVGSPVTNRLIEGPLAQMSEDESVLSEGEDLRDDINGVLAKYTSDASFCVFKSFTDASEPGLAVEGIGSLRLPLSQRDAAKIIALSESGAQSRRGAKKHKNNKWEVDASKLSFETVSWSLYFSRTILPHIRQGLGLDAKCRAKLSKLILYGAGSSPVITEVGRQSGSAFATIAVLLPSRYSGGLIRISHANETKEFDLAENYNFDTCVIAWHPQAQCTAEPITSGFQLALCYDLNTPNSTIPSPPSPDNHSRELLHVFRKWNNDKYPDGRGAQKDMLIYILKEHQQHATYNGVNALFGRDAHKVKAVRQAAEQLGFLVYLGDLELVIEGYPEETHYQGHSRRRKRTRYDDDLYYIYGIVGDSDEEEEDGLSMLGLSSSSRGNRFMDEETGRTIRITRMAQVDGEGLFTSGFDIEEGSIIQKNSFSGVAPDERKGGGGRCAGYQLEYHYYRSVLVLIQKENAHKFLFSAYGLQYALRMLKDAESSDSTSELRKLVALAVEKLTPKTEDDVTSLAKTAINWNDLALWEAICKNVGYDIKKIGIENCVQAVSTFSFKDLRPILEECLEKTNSVKERLSLLCTISTRPLPRGDIQTWCRNQKLKALQIITKVTVDDVPAFVELMKVDGVSTIMHTILPTLRAHSPGEEFWIEFVKALHAVCGKDSNRDHASQDRRPWALAIQESLQAAVDDWVRGYGQRAVYNLKTDGYLSIYFGDRRVDTSIEMLDLCLLVGHASLSQPILESLINATGTTSVKFDIVYHPFLRLFLETLSKYKIAITTPPFATFSRRLIGMYLRDLLGSGPLFSPPWGLICADSCTECREVSDFLSSTHSTLFIKLARARRDHVEAKLSNLQGLKTSVMKTTNPHSLLIEKSPEMVAAYKLVNRRAQANEFLAQFGNAKTLSDIMDRAYPDIHFALYDVRRFARTDQELAAMMPPSVATTTASATGTSRKTKLKMEVVITRRRPSS